MRLEHLLSGARIFFLTRCLLDTRALGETGARGTISSLTRLRLGLGSNVCVRFREREKKEVKKGTRWMPKAPGGEEGRDKLREAAGIGKYEMIRRYPNGTTRCA